MATQIHHRRQKDVITLTFAATEPGKPPTLDLDVLDQLDDILIKIAKDPRGVRALLIRSNSEKYFIVGANIKALATLDAQRIGPWVRRGHEVFNRLSEFPLPVIAWVEGYALGGGLELALACDLILATDNAKLGQPEAKLGLVSGWGGSHRLPRRVGLAKAKEMFFTGKIIDARAARDVGLVDYVGLREAVRKYLDELLAGIRDCSPFAVAQMKLLLDESLDTTIDENGQAEANASYRCMSDQETLQRIQEFLQK